jgi:ABC-type amino acid transport substrate-binding protein
MLAEICKDLIAEVYERPAIFEDDEERMSSVDVLIPTFYSFPTVGAVISLGFVLFAGWYIGSSVSPGAYSVVISGGLASLFGGTALAIPFALGLADMPRDLFRLFLSADVIVSRFGTFVSVMHYATIALVGTFALDNMVRIRRIQLLRTVVVSVLLISVTLIGVRYFYTYVVVVPYTQDELLKGLHNLRSTQQSVVHADEPPPAVGAEFSRPRALAEIKDSGILRVCYVEGNYPLSFFNAEGKLVGFDIEMAHKFARRLSVALEFLPMKDLEKGAYRLDSGYCDVLFNSLALDFNRTDAVAHTDPIDTVTVAFIVPDHRRDEFATWDQIRAQGRISIATSAFQSLAREVWPRIPEANEVSLSSFEQQSFYFETGAEFADAFLDAAEEGAAWTVLYPRYTVVVPRPAVRLPTVYVVARDNPSLLRAMNAWLLIEKTTGGVDEIYDYWIQGKTDQVEPPRWSVIRDVLGWVD